MAAWPPPSRRASLKRPVLSDERTGLIFFRKKLKMNGLLLTSLILALSAPNPLNMESLSGNQEISLRCTASWYSENDPGILKTTANMEIFDDDERTCAMWDVPFGTTLKVTNLDNGKSVVVRVNDRGPAKRLVKEGRLIDLTKRAFSEIAPLEKGLITVKVTIQKNRKG